MKSRLMEWEVFVLNEIMGFLLNMGWLAILALIVGLGFVVFEMFHPGFGAPGIIGGILLVVGVILSAHSVIQALIMVIVLMAILGIVLTLILQSAAKGHLSRHLVLNDILDKDYKAVNTEDMEYFIGKVGTTLTVLRPSGLADFDGVRLDVVSDGGYISLGTKVEIIKIEGRRIIVKTSINK